MKLELPNIGNLTPFKNGKVNAKYANKFKDIYCLKTYYANKNMLNYIPKFRLADRHIGKEFIILGCGSSLADFNAYGNEITIGTNTSCEFHHADYLVIANPFALIRASQYLDLDKTILLITSDLWHGKAQKLWVDVPAGRVIPYYADFYSEPLDRDRWDISQGRLLSIGQVVGLLAIDMAILMGASSILLVGIDGYKGKTLKEMYAGNYYQIYKDALASRVNLKNYQQKLWDREDKVEEQYLWRKDYCQKNNIRFKVFGNTNYKKLIEK